MSQTTEEPGDDEGITEAEFAMGLARGITGHDHSDNEQGGGITGAMLAEVLLSGELSSWVVDAPPSICALHVAAQWHSWLPDAH